MGPLMSSVVRHALSDGIMPAGAVEVPREPANLSKTLSRGFSRDPSGTRDSPSGPVVRVKEALGGPDSGERRR